MTIVRSGIAAAILGAAVAIGIAQQPAPGQPTPGQPTPGVPAQPGTPGASTPRMPPRAGKPGEDPQKGTAVLRGYVVAADTGGPLRRAMVRAGSQDGRAGGMTTTDADGRFEIRELTGGRYSLSASKAGYVGMQYGQRRPDQPGTMLEIIDGQLVEKIAFSLPRGGVITGRVTDEFGDPVAGAQVTALRFRYMNGARRLLPAGAGATTDDLGAFRLFGLVPGEYYVSGALRTETMMGPPTAASSIIEGFAPTYYPGTPNAAEAQRVTVKVAHETTNIAFALTATKLARINGRAVTSTGEPIVQGFVNAMVADRSGPMMMMMGFMGATTRADGTFQINGVPSGTYNLRLQPRGMPNTPTEVGQVRVTVASEDLDNVLIVASRGGVARGVITSDDNTPLPMRPQQVNVFVRPSSPDDTMMGGGFARVNDDWTFEISNLFNGGVISASLAESPDWTFKAVYLNGQEVTDAPLEVVPGQTVEGLQIVFSRRRTELSGGITDDRGRPETDATVVIFPEDSNRWTYQTRYIRTARPNQEGRYTLLGMPPHDYYVVAVKTMEMGQWQDPEFLESVRDQATRVSLGEGETKVQDLKIAKQ